MTGLEDTRWGCSFLQAPGATCPPVLWPYIMPSQDPPQCDISTAGSLRQTGAGVLSLLPVALSRLRPVLSSGLMAREVNGLLTGKKRLEVTT